MDVPDEIDDHAGGEDGPPADGSEEPEATEPGQEPTQSVVGQVEAAARSAWSGTESQRAKAASELQSAWDRGKPHLQDASERFRRGPRAMRLAVMGAAALLGVVFVAKVFGGGSIDVNTSTCGDLSGDGSRQKWAEKYVDEEVNPDSMRDKWVKQVALVVETVCEDAEDTYRPIEYIEEWRDSVA